MASESNVYPLTPEAQQAQEAEIAALTDADFQTIRQYWERYDNLAERVFFQGLKPEELADLGFQLRDGVKFTDLTVALRRGLQGLPKTYEADIGRVGAEFQRVLAFSPTDQKADLPGGVEDLK